jgi:hypothetical protein
MRELAAKRTALRAHCEVQRSHMMATAHDIEARLASLDRTIAVIQRYAHRPLLIAAGLGLLAMVGPRRLLRWTSRGAFLFASGKKLMRLVRR